jgi:hypothetical protein
MSRRHAASHLEVGCPTRRPFALEPPEQRVVLEVSSKSWIAPPRPTATMPPCRPVSAEPTNGSGHLICARRWTWPTCGIYRGVRELNDDIHAWIATWKDNHRAAFDQHHGSEPPINCRTSH